MGLASTLPALDGTALALAPCALLTIVHLASLIVAGRRIGRSPGETTFPAGAPISLVRPVCGLETFSEETLARGFALDHPAYEILFCVADAADPVLPLVRRLVAAHPQVPARILIGDERISDNPKLNNCVRGWEAARHDWIVIADSNVLMPADYLQRMQAAWRADTGLVCSTPIGARPDGIWAAVECAFLNTLQARWQYAGEAVGLGFAQGKSMLWHRPFLEAQGGIRALAAEIAEDAAATKLVRAAGRRVHLVAAPFEQPLGRRRASEVWSRQIRWARLRRVTFPLFFAPEIASGTLLPFLLAGLLAGTWTAAAGLAALAALGYAAELRLATRAGWFHAPRLLLAFVLRDALIPLVWCAAWTHRAIVWRGNAMDIRLKPVVRPRRVGRTARPA
ncbi:ceramide glucosyltransferase [Methylobacterium sp. E-041]|uniref:ceramide glucosyltransferase n=1 Tax=unclassified Methylobacterium TaxID=2615210 RepID=UPI0011C79703|nr:MULTISPECIES: ceramide glucosyltransferase [unclassified Methylobacterium]MCJ2107723.1 ceramide glucosyltransferase [Methylobacterium sp. E-041]TXN39895.1 glycosyltransferase [Methylobacterium sp. WL93]TXN53130.1 glycosyltransferase [Methylobacterium sp. WL119]TXN70893.1 glycosyltransferase [Methylobacterium sp. WL30]